MTCNTKSRLAGIDSTALAAGAGGGDCAIVLTDPAQKESIAAKLRAAGHDVLDFNVNADGVRLES